MEEEKAQEETLTEAFTRLVDRERLPAFEDGDFNINDIVQQFQTKTTTPNVEFLDQGQSAQQFELGIKDALSKAFRQPTQQQRDDAIKGVFSTLGRVASRVEADSGTSPVDFIESVLNRQFPLGRFQQLEGKIIQPVDIPALVNILFATDLDDIQKRSLSLEEITAIRTNFQTDLRELEQSISNDDGDFIFGQNTFRMLQDYVQTHVENAQLKQLLLGDIQQQIAASRQKLGIRLGEAPPQIVPLSATKVQVLRESVNEQIGTVLANDLQTINVAQERIRASRVDPVQLKAQQRVRVLEAVRTFNEFVERNQIRNPRSGMLITIGTETAPQLSAAAQVALVDAPVARRVVQTRPVPTVDLIDNLNVLSQQLLQNTIAFEHVPMTIRDPSTGQTRTQILQGVINLDQTLNRRRLRGSKPKKVLSEGLGKRAKFPNIDILQARRRRQQRMADGMERFGAKPRHITIKADVSLAELAKIANMVIMETGSLEDAAETPLLDIIKGQTTIQQVISVFMDQMKKAAGNDYTLIYVPANFFGGMFVDGPMEVIHTARMLVSPVGGNIFSSIFNTVGNVVKTVASVPLAIAGSVFGGQLPAHEKPLFVNGGIQRPVARINTFPQTGGAIPKNVMIQGEQQPEPFINRSLNQQFHIQPFPFGGRIDNTGFIDRSQVNPKFAWANTPVRNFTYYR